MSTPKPDDLVVIKRPEATLVLAVDGYKTRVLVIVPRSLNEHDDVLARTLRALGDDAKVPARQERRPIPRAL